MDFFKQLQEASSFKTVKEGRAKKENLKATRLRCPPKAVAKKENQKIEVLLDFYQGRDFKQNVRYYRTMQRTREININHNVKLFYGSLVKGLYTF